MRKGIKEDVKGTMAFSQQSINALEQEGYKYFQVKGLTIDKHYDYVEPHYILLVPIKVLPNDQAKKDIYEPINSSFLKEWVVESSGCVEILISNKNYN